MPAGPIRTTPVITKGRPMRAALSYARGSCESVRRVSEAPSSLRLTVVGEELRPRITTLGEWTGW